MVSFESIFAQADALFNAGNYAAAKSLYRTAIEAFPTHPEAHTAAVRVQYCDELSTAREWYGDEAPDRHAIGILGSLSIEHSERPYVHHVLLGRAAYEAFHIGRYMSDLLRLRQFPCLIQPSFMLLYLAMIATKEKRVEFVELGCSLYEAFEKLKGCEQRARSCGVDALPRISHIGVELSEKLRILAAALHASSDVSLHQTWRDVPAPQHSRFSASIGVGNYAFVDKDQFADWLILSRASVVREFFAVGRDFRHHIMGKRFVRFDLIGLADRLAVHGYRTSLLAFRESPPFLEHESDHRDYDGVFLDGWLLVHNLSDIELQSLADLVVQCGADRLPLFWDPGPLITPSAANLLSPRTPEQMVADVQWAKDYVIKPDHRDYPYNPRFDFSARLVRDALKVHLELLDREYGGILKPRLDNAEVADALCKHKDLNQRIAAPEPAARPLSLFSWLLSIAARKKDVV